MYKLFYMEQVYHVYQCYSRLHQIQSDDQSRCEMDLVVENKYFCIKYILKF